MSNLSRKPNPRSSVQRPQVPPESRIRPRPRPEPRPQNKRVTIVEDDSREHGSTIEYVGSQITEEEPEPETEHVSELEPETEPESLLEPESEPRTEFEPGSELEPESESRTEFMQESEQGQEQEQESEQEEQEQEREPQSALRSDASERTEGEVSEEDSIAREIASVNARVQRAEKAEQDARKDMRYTYLRLTEDWSELLKAQDAVQAALDALELAEKKSEEKQEKFESALEEFYQLKREIDKAKEELLDSLSEQKEVVDKYRDDLKNMETLPNGMKRELKEDPMASNIYYTSEE